MKSIYFSRFVSSRLSEIEGVTVGNMILPEETEFPAIVFEKIAHPLEYDKEGITGRAEYNFVVMADEYKQALDIADKVCSLFTQAFTGALDGVKIGYSRLQNIDEIWDNGVYIIRLGWLFKFAE